MKVTRVKTNRKGIEQLIKSEPMQALLAAKAEAVGESVRAAGVRVEGVPGRVDVPVTTTVRVGNRRARSRVYLDHPSGIAVESKHGILVASLDAARDT